MNYRFVSAGLVGLAAASVVAAAPAPNVANGQAVFKAQCALCHATVAGKTGLGPTLAGIVGRKPGSVAGFTYSPAMKAATAKWSKATLNSFIESPSTAMRGTRMAFAGVKDAQKRADLIAYLATLK